MYVINIYYKKLSARYMITVLHLSLLCTIYNIYVNSNIHTF